jgi:hypothetical protein
VPAFLNKPVGVDGTAQGECTRGGKSGGARVPEPRGFRGGGGGERERREDERRSENGKAVGQAPHTGFSPLSVSSSLCVGLCFSALLFPLPRCGACFWQWLAGGAAEERTERWRRGAAQNHPNRGVRGGGRGKGSAAAALVSGGSRPVAAAAGQRSSAQLSPALSALGFFAFCKGPPCFLRDF